MSRGVRPRERVGLVFGGADWVDYAVAFVAVTAAGATAVPVSASLPGARAAELFDHCGAAVVLGPSNLEFVLHGELPAVSPDDRAQIIYTSGTTGTPKGVFASHANLTHGLGRLAHSRHVVHAFPLGTNAAQTMLMASLVARPTFVVAPSFEPAGFAALVRRHAATSVFVVPTMVTALLPFADDLKSVELVASSAAPLPPAVALRLSKVLPDVTIVNSYTSTEAAPAFVSMVFDPDRPTALGRSPDVWVDGAGQVWLRSPHARGYYGQAPFAGGWVRTGDVGYLDPDGYLHLLDRASDVVKVAGHRVSTIRVEHALHEHPAVADATVVGLPHPTMGTMLVASVVLSCEVPDLRAFLADRLAPYEIPARIDVTNALPRNEMGKVLKGQLAALLSVCRSVLGVPEVGPGDNFFALGGDSLTASRLAEQAGLPLEVVFGSSNLAEMAGHMTPTAPEIVETDDVALTATQESLLVWMHKTDPPRDAGPVSVGIRIRDTFDAALLEQALGVVIGRHEALRMVLRDRRPVVLDWLAPAVTLVDTPQEVLADREGRFDLERGPVVRAAIAQLDDHDYVLGLAVHHLVFDGASMGVLLHELGAVYSALRSGSPVPFKPLPLGYRAHVAWTRAQWERTTPYWTQALAGAPSHLDFPARRQDVMRIRHASLRFDFGPAARLHELAHAHHATAFMVIAACWASTLARFTGSADIVLLVPLQGRTRPGSERLIGCLVQSVLLRIDASECTFDELLARVKRSTLDALEHQYHPFARFYQAHSGASFLRVEHWAGPAHFPGLESEPHELPRALEADWPTADGQPDRQSPELAVVEQQDGTLSAWLLWNQHAFDRSTMDDIARELRKSLL